MTKSELKFNIAKWAKKYGDILDMDYFDSPLPAQLDMLKAKDELENILNSANCERIYQSSDKVMPNADTVMYIDKNKSFISAEWVGNDLIFHYKEK